MSSYENQLLLDEFKGQIDHGTSIFVVQYVTLRPDKVWELRSNLAKNKSTLKVVRKRVFGKAATGKKFAEVPSKGPICAVFVNQPEPMDALSALVKFKKANAEAKINILCGEVDGKLMTGPEVEYLSSLPNLDGMRAQFLALLVSPMAHLLSVMEAKMEGSTSETDQKN
jgi:large subunit ribosomal protein L10